MSDLSSDSEDFESADEFESEDDLKKEETPAQDNVSSATELDTQIAAVSLAENNEESLASQSNETEEDTWPPKVHHHHVHEEEPPFVDEDGDVTVWDDECLEEENQLTEALDSAPAESETQTETKKEHIPPQDAVNAPSVAPSAAALGSNIEEPESTEIPKELLEKASRRPTERGKRTAPAKKTFGAVRLTPHTDSSLRSAPIKAENRSLERLAQPIQGEATPKATSVEKKPPAQESSGWGWGWGSSLLSTATAGVSALSNQVSSVLHNVEAGFSIPDPEELAKEDREKEAKMTHVENGKEGRVDDSECSHSSQSRPGVAFGTLLGSVSQLGKFVESTGSKVLTGGLETLEFLGKKTIDALQEGDPGFKKTKALLEGEKISLSQVLREAKEAQDRETALGRLNEPQETPKVQFTTLFDQQNGLVHLEALEMLSKQCEGLVASKRNKLRGENLETKETFMETIDSICTLDESDVESNCDIEQAAKKLSKLGIDGCTTEKLLLAKKDSDLWLQGVAEQSLVTPELRVDTLSWLCRLAVSGLEFYHKAGERIMVCKLSMEELEELAEIMVELTRAQCSMLSIFAESVSDAVVKISSSSDLTTELFLEASSCEMYLRNALKLLVPIINNHSL